MANTFNSRRSRDFVALFVLALALLTDHNELLNNKNNSVFVAAFSNEYKPPVKSSLQTFQDPRRGVNNLIKPPPIHPSDAEPTRPSSSKAAAAAASAAYGEAQQRRGPASFERRMRQAIFGVNPAARRRRQQQQQETSTTTTTTTQITAQTTKTTTKAPSKKAPPANWVTIESLQEYKAIVGTESKRRLVVVRFHATYCRACQAVAPYFLQLARKCQGLKVPNSNNNNMMDDNDNDTDVLFVNVPVTQRNAALHRGLQVPSLPFCHVYYPGAGLVEEQGITRKQFPEFTKKLQSYIRGSCPLPTAATTTDAEPSAREQAPQQLQHQDHQNGSP